MKRMLLLLSLFALSAILSAQTNIPIGTVIAVRLSSSIDTKSCKPGDKVTAKVAQDIPLYNGSKIKAGSRVIGEVLAVTPKNSQPSTIALRFDHIEIAKKMMPISTDLRAIASHDEVRSAQEPTAGTDRGSIAQWDWTTTQIGGDVVYRGGGPVASGVETVGTPVYGEASWGVLAHISSSPGKPCRGPIAGNDNPQALWVFSHDACGVYGYDFTIADADRTTDKIVLESKNGDLHIQRGSAMLLRVWGEHPCLAK